VPTSVLLAVLAAAGLLALAPALTRRYDGTERVAAERATSTARVLSRRRRRRTVPGPRPINPPRFMGLLRSTPLAASPILDDPRGHRPARPARVRRAPARSRPAARRRPVPNALHRRRRVLLALVLLNLVEIAGVVLVGPGFWIGFSVSCVVLLAYLVYLRRRAVVAARVRRARLHKLAWIRTEQAAVRREHDRRAAERQTAARHAVAERDRARREAARASTDYMERYPRTSNS
jgi:hypothetical protein